MKFLDWMVGAIIFREVLDLWTSDDEKVPKQTNEERSLANSDWSDDIYD